MDYTRGDQQWLNVSYSYKSTAVGFSYVRDIDETGKWRWAYFFNPHYVRAEYLFNLLSSTVDHSWEIGIGFGIRGSVMMMNDRIKGWFSIQSGPHYISDAPERQIPGMLFSNQFKLGLHFQVISDLGLEPFVGFRHMSNGEVRLPNGGINNRLYGLALAKSF